MNLALLVALVSVITAGVPAIRYLFTSSNADFVVGRQSEYPPAILVTNRGRRPGTFIDAVIFVSGKIDDHPDSSSTLLQQVATEKGIKLVEPDKSIALTFQKNEAGDLEKIKRLLEGQNPECRLKISLSDFNGKPIYSEMSIKCRYVQSTLGLRTSPKGQSILPVQAQLYALSNDAQFITVARAMQPYLANRSPGLQQQIRAIDPKALRLTGNAEKARQVVYFWAQEDDASPLNQQQWLDAIGGAAAGASVVREKYPKANNNRVDVEAIQRRRQAAGAESKLIEEGTNWILITSWPRP